MRPVIVSVAMLSICSFSRLLFSRLLLQQHYMALIVHKTEFYSFLFLILSQARRN